MNFKRIASLSYHIKKGSASHFKLFFDETHRVVYTVCMKMGLSQEDAEEIVQDTYVQFWKQRDNIDENDGIIGLLKLIAKRLVIKKINKREPQLQNNLEEVKKISDEVDAPHIFKAALLKDTVEQLPQVQKEIIKMFYFEGLTTIEISEYMNISVRTVENNMYRAKKKLKSIFEERQLDLSSFYDFFNE